MSSSQQDIIRQPNKGFQHNFAASSVDIVFGGGCLGGGKSHGIALALAEPLMTDPNFRALISRKTLGNLKSGGGFVDTFKDIFGDFINIRQADSPRISFPSGAFVDLTYIDDSNLDKMRERAKGWQYDVIAIDEITEMSWEAFSYLQTRNRGRSKTFTGKFFATLNPKRTHWTRVFLDWYIGLDGFIIPERNGRVRFFFIYGDSVKDIVWGDTKEEVYDKCRISIDRKLKHIGEGFSYKNFIKSFVFYQGNIAENKPLIDTNPNYIGSVAAAGGRMAQALFDGNFNVDVEQDLKMPIKSEDARKCFVNDPKVNGDKWITVDLADYGTDNLVALAWNGFHVINILIVSHSSPRENAIKVKSFAQKNGVADCHIIFDGTAGRYFNDYIPDAIPYLSSMRPKGIYFLTAMTLKDLCYLRLTKMIENQDITFSDEVAKTTYTHQNLKYILTVQNEFLEECAVVNFDTLQSGKKKLWSKKQMNRQLGNGRSMDLLDPCAMRMLPCCDLEYGTEIEAGFKETESDEKKHNFISKQSVFDDSLWF